MEDSFTLTALRMALARRAIEPGLVHHSDRDSQYASKDYTDLITTNGIAICRPLSSSEAWKPTTRIPLRGGLRL